MKINKKSTLREEYFFKVKICRVVYYALEGTSLTIIMYFEMIQLVTIVANAKIVIFILSARRECFLCMKRSFTPRRRSRQYKPLNAQKHLRARNINNIFSIIDSKN
jgi:hypothetical protein